MIDHVEQPRIDLVAPRQQLVQVHRSHHRAQVGRGELHDGDVEFGYLIGGLGGFQHLEEHDAVHRDHRIVLCDDLLPGDIEYLFHHVDLAADAIDERNDEIEARMRDMREPAEAFDGILIALPDHRHARHDERHHQYDQKQQEIFHGTPLRPSSEGYCPASSCPPSIIGRRAGA